MPLLEELCSMGSEASCGFSLKRHPKAVRWRHAWSSVCDTFRVGMLVETLEGEGPWKEVIGGVLGRDFWVPGSSLFLSFSAAYVSGSVPPYSSATVFCLA